MTSEAIGYAEFGSWYDDVRASVLDPALIEAQACLDELLRDSLSTRDLTRIRRASGRVKSKRRAWRKLKRLLTEGAIESVGDIPDHIHDLVGMRITCTNLRDIDMVQATLDALPVVRTDPIRDHEPDRTRVAVRSGLSLYPSSERDYVHEPKESGYRGWHINLCIPIDVDGASRLVTCELQVRTLLQDSWGELTHEDTYSKDGALPPLVEVLSKRMADLFSTLDDIAEDLRTELDRIDEAAVGAPELAEGDPTLTALTEQGADAASLLLDRWKRLDRPVALSALAWELQREFGAEVSDGWFGHGGFKRFLRQALPDAEISSGRHVYLLPADATEAPGEDPAEPPESPSEPDPHEIDASSPIPTAAQALRRADQGFPLLETDQWAVLFAHLAESWRRVGTIEPSGRVVSRLTRSARDRAQAAGQQLSRRHLDYVAKSVLGTDGAGAPLDAAELAEAFTIVTLQRMTELRILGERNRKGRARVRNWLTPPGPG